MIASSPAGSQVNFRTVNQVFPFSQALINPGVPCVIYANSTATCAGGQLTLTRLDGFEVLPTTTLFQSSVDSWNQFGLRKRF
ncbi:MAG: hypothetical protein ACKOPO_07340 [Novosphingobium sp.]